MAPSPPQGRVFEFAGFEYRWHPQLAQVRIPLAAPATIGLIGAVYFRRRARRERRPGVCHGCGYDLRATRERCPECGAVPATLVTANN